MKTKFLLIVLGILALGATALILVGPRVLTTETPDPSDVGTSASPNASPRTGSEAAPRVPKYQMASETRDLSPTLPPSKFFGKAREAYQVAKEIPQTLAQLPCYCHCDEGLGHKSLHTCFVDDHAAHCAVCVDEALLAYSLQRDQKLSPDQVREKIIEKFSTGHQH